MFLTFGTTLHFLKLFYSLAVSSLALSKMNSGSYYSFSNSNSSASDSQSRGSSVINLSQFSSQTDKENFNILRLRAELIHLLSSELALGLENFRKEMFLKYLITATCPLNIVVNETQEKRSSELYQMVRSMITDWQKKLSESLFKLDEIKCMCQDIGRQRDEFLVKFRARKSSEAEIQRVDEYLKIFQSILKIAQKNYDKVTSEYLVLRHNGKMAQEILNRKRLMAIEKQKQNRTDLVECERDITNLVSIFVYIYINIR